MRNRIEIERRRQKGGITGASFATADNQGKITPTPVGTIPTQNSQLEVTEDTVFQCASLSKPVFAYLVLKLIEANRTKPSDENWVGKFKTDFNLKTPLYTVFRDSEGLVLEGDKNPFLKQFANQEQAKKLTAEMVLSHSTGLPIVGAAPYQLQFEPGTHYAYSGPGIQCLQQAIEELTGPDAPLEALAQAHVFGPLKLSKSTYEPENIAANSLKITAKAYAKFITAWVNDDKLNYAFAPVAPADSMKNDYFPQSAFKLVERIDIKDEDRNLVAWGLGIGLVKNKDGQIVGTYHTGDMGDNGVNWRAGVGAVIDPQTKRCVEAVVYLTKSPNGHILAESCLPEALKPALNYFFPTYGFARNAEELHGTHVNGMNPMLLKVRPPEKTDAVIADSTQQMLMQMKPNPISTKPEPSTKAIIPQEKAVAAANDTQEVAKTTAEEIKEDKQTFNPTPLSVTHDPYKR